jgi:hypothetical protein
MPLDNKIPAPEWRKEKSTGRYMVAVCPGVYRWDATNPDGTL